MKKVTILNFLFLLSSLVFISSCSSDDDKNLSLDDGFFIKAKIDGVSFEVTGELLCTYVSAVTFNIQANKLNEQEGITLTIFPNDITTQTYPMQQSLDVIVTGQYYMNDDSYTTIQDPNGSITITNYDPVEKIVEGTFSFVGKHLTNNSTKNITEGSFRCRGLN